MNGPQDLGGQMGFGPIAPEPNESVFHADWEKRALGLVLAAGAHGAWNIDESRHARESLPPAFYYGSSYYQIWIAGLETLLARHGFLDGSRGPTRTLHAADIPGVIARGGPCNRAVASAPRFAAGQRIRTRNINPTGHTRLPRYARDKLGQIETVHDAHVFPDTNAHHQGEQPQYLYTVVFDASELWGDAADPALTISIDAWESYLEPA